MTSPQAPLWIVPEANLPTFEALDAQTPATRSVIFPPGFTLPNDHVSLVGDWEGEVSIPRDSPLRPMMQGLHTLEEQTALQQKTEGMTDWTKAVMIAVELQQRLVQCINNVHIRLLAQGYSHTEVAEMLKGHIEDRDQLVGGTYDDAIAEDKKVLKLGKGELMGNDGSIISLGPLDEEREKAIKHMERYKLLKERLKFEWMSSQVIVAPISGLDQAAA